jgi:hypothetical protein
MWRALQSLLRGGPEPVSYPPQQHEPRWHEPQNGGARPLGSSSDRPVSTPANRRGPIVASRTPVIALAVSDHDREVLTGVYSGGPVDLYLAASRVEAWDVMHRLRSPVVLYDRDWPNAEWRTTVHTFASSPQRPCVILASRVADEYLWQELIRCGGHDLLAKPLRAEEVNRAVRLALSYWTNARAFGKR